MTDLSAALFEHDTRGRYFNPNIRVSYEREWLNDNRELDAVLAAAGTNKGVYQVSGAALPRDRAVVGVSSEVGVTDTFNLFLDYDFRVGKGI